MRRLALMVLFLGTTLSAQIDPRMVQEMRWRMIGPFRGGRTVAAVGVRNQPNVFYIGVNNGGVWKTTDYGRIWTPIFDDQPTGSIGAIAVAPSDPNIIYVGSGEGLQRPDLSTGDGIYKSSDAGKTWKHLGLRDGQQIPMIAVDRAIQIASSSPSSVIPTGRTKSAASSAPPTAAARSRKSYTRMKTWAGWTWPSILLIRRPSTRCCGRRVRARGRTARSPGRAAGCSSRPTAEATGGN